jgi:hypothetical protein
MLKHPMRHYGSLIALTGLAFASHTLGQMQSENHFAQANDVTWNSLGTNENDSMPVGNGDLALNVWTEQNGDIVLLVAKSDAWSENGQLLKLGRVRVKLTPNPFAAPAPMTQTLRLEAGEVQIQGGKSVVRIWVDASRLVVHLEGRTEQPVELEAKSEVWRAKSYRLGPKAVSQDGFFEWGDPDGLNFGHRFPGARRSYFVVPFQFQQHLPDGLPTRAFGIASAKIPGPAVASLFWNNHEGAWTGQQRRPDAENDPGFQITSPGPLCADRANRFA